MPGKSYQQNSRLNNLKTFNQEIRRQPDSNKEDMVARKVGQSGKPKLAGNPALIKSLTY